MPDTIKWRQPKADEQLRRKRSADEFHRAIKICVITWVVGGIPTLYLIHMCVPEQFWVSAGCLAAVAVLFPVWLASFVHIESRAAYSLDGRRGAHRNTPPIRWYRWRRIEGYRLGDHPDVPGLRVLHLKIARVWFERGWGWARWAFDPAEVDESALRAMLEEHLPGKCWDNAL
jgi:hypothetical protein